MAVGAVPQTVENPFLKYIPIYGPDSARFCREVVGREPYPDQVELFAAYDRRERQIAKRSGHGVGKTFGVSVLAVHHILFRFPQKTVCTAPSSPQLFDALVPEIKGIITMLPDGWRALLDVQAEAVMLVEAPDRSFISFKTSKAETPEAMAGVHSDHVLLICDEASGIPEQVYEAASGSMSGHHATTVLLGNPVRTTGLFYDAFHKLRTDWTTFHTPCVNPDGSLHPNITPAYIEKSKKRWGEDSNAYRVRVLGDFPTSEDDAVIPFEWMEVALTRDVKPLHVREVWGLDVAYTGNDRSALCKRKGNVVMGPIKVWKGLDTMQLCGRIVNEWKDTQPSERPEEIVVDSIGFGAGTADRLRELGLPARGVNVAELPAMKGQFQNLKTELYWMAREWFERRDCRIGMENEELIEELGAVHYKPPTSSGSIRLETSDEIRKHLQPQRSPDLASAFVLTFAGTASSALYGSKNSVSWNTPLKRPIAGIV
jgi:hypothetical protein